MSTRKDGAVYHSLGDRHRQCWTGKQQPVGPRGAARPKWGAGVARGCGADKETGGRIGGTAPRREQYGSMVGEVKKNSFACIFLLHAVMTPVFSDCDLAIFQR
jgi:hypothetical protein